MIKLATALIFALALSSQASKSSACLKQVVVDMRADLKICKDLNGEAKKACRTEASKKAKEARNACPIEQRSSEVAKADSVAKSIPVTGEKE